MTKPPVVVANPDESGSVETLADRLHRVYRRWAGVFNYGSHIQETWEAVAKEAVAESAKEIQRLTMLLAESRNEHLATQVRLTRSLHSGDGWEWVRRKLANSCEELVLRTKPHRLDWSAGTKYEVMGWMHVVCHQAIGGYRTYLGIAVEQQKRADEAEAALAQLKTRNEELERKLDLATRALHLAASAAKEERNA